MQHMRRDSATAGKRAQIASMKTIETSDGVSSR